MRPTREEIAAAVEVLGALQFFPPSEGARTGVRLALESMVDTKAHLDWLIMAMLNQVGTWKGTLDMRGIYCTRFKPADGLEAVTDTPGFSMEDLERAHQQSYKQIDGGQRSGKIQHASEILKRLM